MKKILTILVLELAILCGVCTARMILEAENFGQTRKMAEQLVEMRTVFLSMAEFIK